METSPKPSIKSDPESSVNSTKPNQTVSDPPKKKSFWKWFFSIVGGCGFLLIICSVCFYISAGSQTLSSLSTTETTLSYEVVQGSGDDMIAEIDITGFISDFGQGDSLLTGSTTSAESVGEMISYAIDEHNVKAILFRLNTPGGTLTGSETVCQYIRSAKEHGVYTAAFIETQGASGGYYIASCTDWIISRPDSLTGSIGVAMQFIDTNAFLEELGFKVRTVANQDSPMKIGDDVFEEGSETDKVIKDILDESYEQFIDVIVAGRDDKEADLTRREIIQLADGRIYSGKQAYNNGLVDELGNYDSSIEMIIDKSGSSSDATVITITPELGFWDALTASTIGKLVPIEVNSNQTGARVVSVLN